MVDALERHTGKRPIIYTDITFYEKVLEGAFNSYPYWVRSVAAEPQEHYGNHTRTLWSFTTTGKIPGVKEPVDRNAFAGSRSQGASWLAGRPCGGGTAPQAGGWKRLASCRCGINVAGRVIRTSRAARGSGPGRTEQRNRRRG
jgi:lysozyme